jgi:hypothetical protein
VATPPGRPPLDFQGNLHTVNPYSPVGKLISERGLSVPPRGDGVTVPLSSQDKQDAQELQDQYCPWCGGLHARACPRVKRLAYDQSGKNVIEVEFWRADEWGSEHIVWPEDLVEKKTEDGEGTS